MAKIYEEIRGVPVALNFAGSLEDLNSTVNNAQRELGLERFWDWLGYYYQLYQLDGTFYMGKLDNQLYPSVKTTPLEEFLKDNINV